MNLPCANRHTNKGTQASQRDKRVFDVHLDGFEVLFVCRKVGKDCDLRETLRVDDENE